MSTTRAVWLFIAALTAIRFSLLATTDLSFDEAHYWMWSERLAPAYFSKGPGIAFAIRASTAVFGANEFGVRFFSPVLAAATSLLLFYFARRLFGATAGLWTVIALNATPIFNIGAIVMTIDALSIFFWMAAMFTFWVAVEKPRTLSGLVVLAGYGSADRTGVSLQVHQCVRINFGVTRARARATATPGIQTPRRVFADQYVRSLHDSADCVERAARLDHAGAFALARESRPRLWLSSNRGALVCRGTLHRLFAAAISGIGVGRDRKLAAHQSAIQSSVLNVVWFAGVWFLLASVA